MKPYGFIYLTTNKINNKKYIGQCSYVRNKYWKTYLGSGKFLLKAIKKYGRENFQREILCEAFSKEDLNYLETLFINEYKAWVDENFYNIAKGATSTGGFTGKKHTEETKKLMSKKCQNRVITEHLRNMTRENAKKGQIAQAKNEEYKKQRDERIRQIGLNNKGKNCKIWKIQNLITNEIITVNLQVFCESIGESCKKFTVHFYRKKGNYKNLYKILTTS